MKSKWYVMKEKYEVQSIWAWNEIHFWNPRKKHKDMDMKMKIWGGFFAASPGVTQQWKYDNQQGSFFRMFCEPFNQWCVSRSAGTWGKILMNALLYKCAFFKSTFFQIECCDITNKSHCRVKPFLLRDKKNCSIIKARSTHKIMLVEQKKKKTSDIPWSLCFLWPLKFWTLKEDDVKPHGVLGWAQYPLLWLGGPTPKHLHT